ncbi:Fe2+-dependent dioxygenase [Niveibacterium sp. 24ML]|uniref:Fe2+-dependent dioxygenase n=1 Tax=Niveibacterium sp. 24ML TaxID=2985512 RepID=UPI0022709ECA|nr:Fe2+-dependent dioxygenase [Niveibacterium sp. 24ML]MCX9157367.1 Fe2+-dependent dioxygenase [Niveibacterium sp. 24ML]
MLIEVPAVLDADELARLRQLLDQADWADGRITAGSQSAQVKRNRQLPETAPEMAAAREIVLAALSRNAMFFSAALPAQIYPPLFNRYGGGEHFGAHVDNAVRRLPGGGGRPVRTDVSATLFLAEPDSYEGGELVVEDTYGEHEVKLAAGSLVLYPSTSLHRVEPVTSGERVACFMWLQSMVREDSRRALLFDMDLAITQLRQRHGDESELVRLTGSYHNLLRMWAEV